jgi:hypothetical protein
LWQPHYLDVLLRESRDNSPLANEKCHCWGQ